MWRWSECDRDERRAILTSCMIVSFVLVAMVVLLVLALMVH